MQRSVRDTNFIVPNNTIFAPIQRAYIYFIIECAKMISLASQLSLFEGYLCVCIRYIYKYPY